MKRILLTGGGSAGHVTPNIALIPGLKALGFDIHYVGWKSGIEKFLIEPFGIPYHSISAGKLRRYFDIKNFTDILRIFQGFIQSIALIRNLSPQIVFSKGGFVACPVVWAAGIHRIPVIIHESDITPGLANRLSIPFAKRICFSFPETATKLPKGKAIYTGVPIRETLLSGNQTEGRKLCGFPDEKPVVLIIGGSQGAASINRTTRAALDELLKKLNVCHICGQEGIEADLETKPGYKQFEYVDKELPHLLAMADVVVSRAGATILFELLELRKANLLIPISQKASRGDQLLNARSFEKQGLSYMLTDENLSADSLIEAIIKTYSNRNNIIDTMNSSGSVNGVERVLKVIECYASAT
jgi:UDP-N-acetylglucosamine--N-acetylmuramyl-(pentapeptide) pyrophosphoryl-undecaprenol N-acetylglucosamine transferase